MSDERLVIFMYIYWCFGVVIFIDQIIMHVGSRGGGGGGGGAGVRIPLKDHKNIEFLSNTGPDPLKNHKVTKPAFNYVLKRISFGSKACTKEMQPECAYILGHHRPASLNGVSLAGR